MFRNLRLKGSLWWRVFCLIVLLCFQAGNAWAAEEPVNLLKTDQAKLEYVSDPWIPAEEIAALADGNTLTVCRIKALKDLPVDFIYSFGGEIVSPQGLEIQLQVDEVSNSIVGQVELFGSIVSPQIGYQLLREDPVYAANTPQAFAFMPAGAKWIRVRFKTYAGQSQFTVAELKVPGRLGPPQTVYAFKETPASALEVLGRIKRVSGEFALSKEEEDLFADALDGKFDRWSFDEVLLLVSGARDKSVRQKYLAQLDELAQEAKISLRGRKKTFQKGKRLLQWLHERELTSGYHSGQTDITKLLDDKTFNCVSSAVLYNLLAKRLGLDVRAVQVPDHVFSILYEGLNHADIETTTPEGFNPARDPDVIRQFYLDTGFVYIPQEHKDKRREIGETGLAAAVLYNHGVTLVHESKFQESLLAFFKALSLDVELYTAIHNALAVFARWSVSLVLDNKFPEALKVVGAGTELAPQDAGLRFAHKQIWFIWADSVIDQGDIGKALNILRRAAQAVPDGDFEALQAWVFIKPGQALVSNGQWKKALKLIKSGQKQLPPPGLRELEKWHCALYYAWADSEKAAGRFSKALKVLTKGMRAFPLERGFRSNLAHVAYQWTLAVWKTKGLDQARKRLAKLVKRHARVPEMREAVAAFLAKVIESLLDSGDFEKEALRTIDSFRGLVPEEKEFMELVEYVYDQTADRQTRRQQWGSAINIYDRALKIYPQNDHLQHNQNAVWDAWIRSLLRSGDFENALKICGQALKKAPDQGHFRKKLAYVVQEYSEALYRDQGYVAAEKLLKRLRGQYPAFRELKDVVAGYIRRRLEEIKHLPDYQSRADEITRRLRPLLEDKAAGRKLEISVYDDRARKYLKEKNWEAAIQVYDEALRHYSDDSHVRHNAVAAWDSWYQDCHKRKDWEGALAVCEKGAQQSPDEGHFKNNLAFTVQEYAKDVYGTQGVEKTGPLLAKLLKRYSYEQGIREAAHGHFQYILKQLDSKESKAYEKKGLEVVRVGAKILGDPKAANELFNRLYDRLANEAEKRQDWKGAIAWYRKALKKHPGDKHLLNNLAITWDHWAKPHIRKKEWTKAISIYKKALKDIPGNQILIHNMEYCEEKMKEK